MSRAHGPVGPLNPQRNDVLNLAEIDERLGIGRKDPVSEKVSCILYQWAESTVQRLQADYAREPKAEYKERALMLWKLLLNTVIPLAKDAKGKAYAHYYSELADQLRELAVSGLTPPGIIAEVQKQTELGPRLEYLQRSKSPAPCLPMNMPVRRGQVAALLGDGLTDREIAERLGIAMATVQMHVRHILSYCHAPNRTLAVRRLVESGEMQRFKKAV